MDLVRTQTTFNNGVLYVVGTLDSHYATTLGWAIDSVTVDSFEYINGESQFIPVITAEGEINLTNPSQAIVNIKGLTNRLIRIKFHINMNENPYVLCGFEQDINSSTTIIQSKYFLDMYEFYTSMLNYMSDLSNSCCEIPYYLTDIVLKYNLLKSALQVGDIDYIIPLYVKFYYGESAINPHLLIHGSINNFIGGCNCNG